MDLNTLKKFFDEAKNNKKLDWKKSTFCGIKERSHVNSILIMHIINLLDRDQPWTFSQQLSKRIAAIYWMNRLLKNNDSDLSNRLWFLKHQEEDLKFVTKYCISPNEEVDFESLLKVQREILDLEPGIGKPLVAIVDTFMKLERYFFHLIHQYFSFTHCKWL